MNRNLRLVSNPYTASTGTTVPKVYRPPAAFLTPSPQELRAFRVIAGGVTATRAERLAAGRLVAMGLVRIGLRNNAYKRALDLALLIAQSQDWPDLQPLGGPSLFTDAMNAKDNFFALLSPDPKWARIYGPFPKRFAGSQIATVPHSVTYGTPNATWQSTNMSKPVPNGALVSFSGVPHANYYWYENYIYFGSLFVRGSWHSQFRFLGPGAAYRPTIKNDVAVAPRAISPGLAIGLNPISVPHVHAAKVNRLRELFAPRPDGKPIRDNGPGLVSAPVPLPNLSVGIAPNGSLSPAAPHKFQPPGRRTKERKAKGPLALALAVSDAISEGVDAIDAVYRALPRHMRERNATPQRKLQIIYRNINSLDMNEAIKNIALTQISDAVIGSAYRPLRRAMDRYTSGSPSTRPWFYGPI